MKSQASLAHVRIFRAGECAVINAAHGHPRWNLTPIMARSIAKRASGTLTAEWPDVLAARSMPSDGAGADGNRRPHWPPRSRATWDARKGAGGTPRRPHKAIWKALSLMTAEAKRAGNTERAAALIDALRLVARQSAPNQHGKV